MRNPTTVDEYLDFLDQAIFEANDLLASAEDEGEMDDLSQYRGVYERLAAELQALHEAVRGGRHHFGVKEDLPFMALARNWKKQLPMYDLLEVLNSVHKRGF